MNRLFIYSALTAIVISSCTKDKVPQTQEDEGVIFEGTYCPQNDTLDINQDGIDDFIVDYRHLSTDDIPVSARSIIGGLSPLENVDCLYQAYDGYLFLSPNDTIYDHDTPTKKWFNYGADLVSKRWGRDSGWDPLWHIYSTQNEYYLAFKLQNGGNNELGWLKLEIDINTGEIVIVDMATSNASFIVI